MAESRLKGWLDWGHHLYWISEGLVSLGVGGIITKLVTRYVRLDLEWRAIVWLSCSGVLLFVFAFISSLVRKRKPRNHPQLIIHSAFYGTDETNDMDVTELLRQQARDALAVQVSNNLVPRDPAPNLPGKRLRVKYSYGNDVICEISRPEHSRMVLPEDTYLKKLAERQK